jgi:hypothetical protein
MHEQTTTYNGWSNRETWLASLWLTSDQGSYALLMEALRAGDSDFARADWLEQQLREPRLIKRYGTTHRPKNIYQSTTTNQIMHINIIASGMSSNFSHTLSTVVIFHVLAADPEKDIGAEMITFSDGNLLVIV